MTSRQFVVSNTAHASAPRRLAIDRARALGFDETRTGRVALVATELATNIAQHAREGELLIRETGGSNPAIEILALDKGPGIRNLGQAMADGYSTAGTLGHGLGSLRRQADEFEVFSRAAGGTVIVARVCRRDPTPDSSFVFGGVSVPHPKEQICGDGWIADWQNGHGSVLVVDGLGHGEGAAEAATAAITSFRASHKSSPAAVVDDLHHALRPTRGAALAVAALDLAEGVVRYSGLGNIGAAIISAERKRTHLLSQNGTAGHAARRISESAYPFRAGSVLVMFSDGLGSSWDHAAYPDLWSHDPSIIAGVLYRDFSRGRDDVTVIVGKEQREPALR